MLPTLRQLRYLKLLADHRSFSRAAEAAHVTQPTLSAGIQELERALEATVVDRTRSNAIPTRAHRARRARRETRASRCRRENRLHRCAAPAAETRDEC